MEEITKEQKKIELEALREQARKDDELMAQNIAALEKATIALQAHTVPQNNTESDSPKAPKTKKERRPGRILKQMTTGAVSKINEMATGLKKKRATKEEPPATPTTNTKDEPVIQNETNMEDITPADIKIEDEIENELASMTREDRVRLSIGLNNVGFFIEKKKSDFFATSFNAISAGFLDQGGTLARFTRGMRDSYKMDSEMARKKILAVKDATVTTKISNVGYIAKNILRPVRLIADATGMSPSGVQRILMAGGMAIGRTTGAMKEARLANEKVLEEHRMDVESAQEEAMRIYEEAKKDKGESERVSADLLKKAYLTQIPKNLQKRLQQTAVADSLTQKLLRTHLEFDVNRLNTDIERIEKDGKLTDEKKEAKKMQLLRRWEKRLNDYDRVLTVSGTVDGYAMAARYAETTSKNVVRAMTVHTMYLSLEKLWGNVAHIYSNIDGHSTASTVNRPNLEHNSNANIRNTESTGNTNRAPETHRTNTESKLTTKIEPAPEVVQATPEIQPNNNENLFADRSVSFTSGSGKGGIEGIIELKKQLRDAYHNDFSQAPKSVQDFMADNNATKQAIRLGLYDPTKAEESGLIQEGSVLKFDKNGNILFGKPNASGEIPVLEKYSGKMFDSHHTETRVPLDRPTDTPATINKNVIDQDHIKEDVESIRTKAANLDKESARLESETKRLQEIAAAQEKVAGNYKFNTNPDNIQDAGPSGHRTISVDHEGNANVIFNTTPNANNSFTEGHQQTEGLTEQISPSVVVDNTKDQIGQLNIKYPALSINSFNLNQEQLKAVAGVYHNNIMKLMPKDTESQWGVFRKIQVNIIFTHKDLNNYNPLYNYITKLHKITGLEPRGSGWFSLYPNETTESYMARALQKAATMPGALEKLKL